MAFEEIFTMFDILPKRVCYGFGSCSLAATLSRSPLARSARSVRLHRRAGLREAHAQLLRHLGKHRERVSDQWKVPETLFKAGMFTYTTTKYTGTAKTGTAGGPRFAYLC